MYLIKFWFNCRFANRKLPHTTEFQHRNTISAIFVHFLICIGWRHWQVCYFSKSICQWIFIIQHFYLRYFFSEQNNHLNDLTPGIGQVPPKSDCKSKFVHKLCCAWLYFKLMLNKSLLTRWRNCRIYKTRVCHEQRAIWNYDLWSKTVEQNRWKREQRYRVIRFQKHSYDSYFCLLIQTLM